jgi:hypothetical protein
MREACPYCNFPQQMPARFRLVTELSLSDYIHIEIHFSHQRSLKQLIGGRWLTRTAQCIRFSAPAIAIYLSTTPAFPSRDDRSALTIKPSYPNTPKIPPPNH